jgi:hypothetical protein
MSIPPKFPSVRYSQFPFYNEETTSDVMQESNDFACVRSANVFVTINSFHYNLRPNFVFIHKEVLLRSNYIRGMLAAFQFRTCAQLYSTRLFKERSPKYKNNYVTCYLHDEESGHTLKKKNYLTSIFEKRVWRQQSEE